MTLTPTNLRVNALLEPVGTPGIYYFGWHGPGAADGHYLMLADVGSGRHTFEREL